ncbi:MAG: ABC transporter ATP-binding protein [Candidatus Delongbacteria bacterium]|nr:MAG: ABC transporter ATP-binding protein [Candidatus Delongbacteria bacterium]
MSYEEINYNTKFSLRLWKDLLKYCIPYKKEIIIIIGTMIASAVIDVAIPLLTRYAIDEIIIPKNLDNIYIFSGLFLGAIIFQALNIYLFISLAGKVDMGISYDMRKKGFEHLQKLSFSYYDKTAIGWIMARMTSDIRKLGDTLAWSIVDFFWGVSVMFFISGVMLYLNYKLALLTLIIVPFLIVISYLFKKAILKSHRDVRKMNSKITGSFNEGIMGVVTTKTLVREDKNSREFRKETSSMFNSSVRAAVLSSLYMPIILSLGSIGTAIALWEGGTEVSMGIITYGTLVAFFSYIVQFFDPIIQLARIFTELQSAQASAERVISMIDADLDIDDSEKIKKIYGDITGKNQRAEKIDGDIEFKNISFSYGGGENYILKDFNLKVKKGEKIALIGETGSGKTTIVNLICRFYEPVKGELLIDGKDYRERSQYWLQSNLGYVLQSPHLFSGTIMENIRYGRLDASDEEVYEVAKKVDADQFILKMKDGYNSEVGEGGNLLSVGQKQLISFARAILADPSIFILDEATSSVDTETEFKIQNAITKLLENRTSFIIAHRLSTIRSADRILVIDKGKIIEEGSHESLIEKKGHYYRLYTNQFKSEQIEKSLDRFCDQ